MSGPTRILFAIDCLVRGGTELQLIGLIDRLDRSRYEPWLLTIRPTDPSLVPADCRHLAWQVPRLVAPGGVAALAKLVRLLRREKIAVVQAFFQDSTLLAACAARIARVPVRIACFRDLGFWSTRLQDLFLRQAYGFMTDFIANAQVVGRHFSARFGLEASRVHVIRNGVDRDALPFVAHEGPVTDVGVVGNMTREVKRIDLFIRAAAEVARKYPGIRWHIIGDGHLRGGLEMLAAGLGVRDKLVFAGRVGDVAGYLGRLQVGVVCSDSEGLSNALIEYMLRGVVSVATAVGGNPELVTDGETGLLVPPGDADALAAALVRVIESPGLRQRLAGAARTGIEQSCSWQRCLTEHDGIYRKASR